MGPLRYSSSTMYPLSQWPAAYSLPFQNRVGMHGHEAGQASADEDADRWRSRAGLEGILRGQGSEHFTGALGRGIGIPCCCPEKFGDRAGVLFT